jgi:regulator of sigma E protease
MTSLLALIVVLGVLIFIHELGHFVAAKWAGIYVHRFSLGMGSPIKALTFKRGETEYAISWLPLGGYVKMASAEEEALAKLEGGQAHTLVPPDRMFEAKPVWKRIIVILAGVTMNILFAWLVYSGLAMASGRDVTVETRLGLVDTTLIPAHGDGLRALSAGDRIVAVNGDSVRSWNDVRMLLQSAAGDTLRIATAGGRTVILPIPAEAIGERAKAALALQPWWPAVLTFVDSSGPASRAGLRVGDSLLAINGHPVVQWYDVTSLVEPHPNQPVTVSFARGGLTQEVTFVTDSAVVPDSGKTTRVVGRLGVGSIPEYRHESFGFTGALREGTAATREAVVTIGRSVKGLLNGEVAGKELAGPIGIGQMAGQSARLGLVAFLTFMAFLSANLAVLNILPIPLLDGGQLVFLLAEGVLRRPLPLKLREVLSMVGLVLLALLMVFAFSNDLRRVFAGWLG